MIRHNHQTGAVWLDWLRWGLIPYWCEDPKGWRKPIIEDAVKVEPVGEFELKGIRRPLAAYNVVTASPSGV